MFIEFEDEGGGSFEKQRLYINGKQTDKETDFKRKVSESHMACWKLTGESCVVMLYLTLDQGDSVARIILRGESGDSTGLQTEVNL